MTEPDDNTTLEYFDTSGTEIWATSTEGGFDSMSEETQRRFIEATMRSFNLVGTEAFPCNRAIGEGVEEGTYDGAYLLLLQTVAVPCDNPEHAEGHEANVSFVVRPHGIYGMYRIFRQYLAQCNASYNTGFDLDFTPKLNEPK